MLIQILISMFLLTGMPSAQSGPDKDMREIISQVPAGTRFSVSIFDAGKRKAVLDYNSSASLKPASNIKLFTTAAALFSLGGDYKIRTSVYYNRNNLNGGRLNGNLYIKGSGNALFSGADLDYLAGEIERTGIKLITGGIIYDNTLFKKKVCYKTAAASLSHLDVPTISPLSINRNIIELTFSGSGRGTRIISSPASKYISIVNNAAYSNSGKKLSALLKETPDRFEITINSLPANNGVHKIYFFVKNPEILLSLLLMEKLENHGIKIMRMPLPGLAPADNQTEISTLIPLAELIRQTNKESDNFLAEEIKSIFESRFSAGVKSEREKKTMLSLLTGYGINTSGLNLADASGISPAGKATTSSLSSLLYAVYTRPDLYKIFRQSLSIAGIDGTMKERFLNSPLKNNFYGKTGFMAGVSSISGYMHTKSGTNIIISVLINFKEKDIGYYESIEKEILELIYYKN